MYIYARKDYLGLLHVLSPILTIKHAQSGISSNSLVPTPIIGPELAIDLDAYLNIYEPNFRHINETVTEDHPVDIYTTPLSKRR